MIATKISGRARGRPRAFDVEAALDTAQALFHAHGYDAVSVATLTDTIGISPPSFYAAFGSKAALFDRVLQRYAASTLPIDRIFAPGRDVPEALADLLLSAAELYAADPGTAGCLVLESARTGDGEDCTAARRYRLAQHERVRAFIAADRPDKADALTDFLGATLSGLSACAREGWSRDRLVGIARMASDTLSRAYSD